MNAVEAWVSGADLEAVLAAASDPSLRVLSDRIRRFDLALRCLTQDRLGFCVTDATGSTNTRRCYLAPPAELFTALDRETRARES